MRSLAPLLLTGLLLGILSCGVNIDVSNLEFEPATKDVTTPDKEVAPADALGDVVPPDTADVAPVDAGPDAVTPQKCWQVYECVVYEKGGWDLELKKFQQCGAEVVNNKLTSPPVSELYKCLDICMINDNMEEFGNCLMTNCIGYTLKCVHDSAPGDKTCADALMCLVEECSEIEPTPGNELDCSLNCYSGMSLPEIDELTVAIEECAFKDGGTNPDCLPSLERCYAGSGPANKSCLKVSNCLQGCGCDDPSPAEPADDCQPELCMNECMYGMSMEGYELLTGSQACFWDKDSNVFLCLRDLLHCFEEIINGQDSCGDVVEALRPFYMAKNLSQTDRYGAMVGMVMKLKGSDATHLVKALECLAGKWEATPGYGNIPEQQWKTCSLVCPQ